MAEDAPQQRLRVPPKQRPRTPPQQRPGRHPSKVGRGHHPSKFSRGRHLSNSRERHPSNGRGYNTDGDTPSKVVAVHPILESNNAQNISVGPGSGSEDRHGGIHSLDSLVRYGVMFVIAEYPSPKIGPSMVQLVAGCFPVSGGISPIWSITGCISAFSDRRPSSGIGINGGFPTRDQMHYGLRRRTAMSRRRCG